MDICIGGSWNRFKILKNQLYDKKFFRVKIKGLNTVSIYQKRLATIKRVKYIFWVLADINDTEATKCIQSYLFKREKLLI
ncbi:hypothetical protein [Acinetobacter rudis]|uniref:Uncharacterized protein n=1 Tax=Acinetobacter rudis CIP 110305 TaxID=421052 RepID=S3N0H7_9GAMM|nr:hypothetical protein [Acinetobacter rudis]EPF72113.1 hypothetical protein F945_02163 [Acinetobacter rudis CIP 110305]